jgi:hypothetical protein
MPVPGEVVYRLAMDDKYLYWTTGGGGNLFRRAYAPPQNGVNTILATTQFSQGRLSPFPMPSLFRVGDWLIFDDRQFAERSSGWTIRQFNVVNHSDKILVHNQNSDILYSFSTDGHWLVWITGDLSRGTVVESMNLQTGLVQELTRSDSIQYEWEQAAVSAGWAAAIYRGPEGRSLTLFDLSTMQNRKLLTAPPGSDMSGLSFDGDFIAWKTGVNYQGSTAVYSLQTAAVVFFPDWGIQPLLVGHWLTWHPAYEKPLYAVDLEKSQVYLVAAAQKEEELTSAAIYGDVIAWGRMHVHVPDLSKVDSTVEWRTLP